MAKVVTQDKIIEACLDGIEESFLVYKKWSGGEWLWNAPEYLITVKIAEEIAKISQKQLVTLEDNLEYLLDVAGANEKGFMSSDIRANGRSDIVLWWGNRTPRAIVEVKNSVYGITKIDKDIRRIKSVLKQEKKYSKIQFGVVAFYTDATSKSGGSELKLIDRINKIYGKMKSKKKCSLYYRTTSVNNDLDAYGIVCLVFKR